MFDCFNFCSRMNTATWLQAGMKYELDWREHENFDDLYGHVLMMSPTIFMGMSAHAIIRTHKAF